MLEAEIVNMAIGNLKNTLQLDLLTHSKYLDLKDIDIYSLKYNS